MVRAILLGLLLGFIVSTAIADDSVVVGDPASCHLKIEYEAKEQMLHLRPTIPIGAECEITPQLMQEGLRGSLEHHKQSGNLKLIFLGRLANYAWLSRGLSGMANGSPDWNSGQGKAANGSDNVIVAKLVQRMLAEAPDVALYVRPSDVVALKFMNPLLREYGYRAVGVSAEKVISYGFPHGVLETIGPPYLPMDALVHLRIEKTP